MGDLGTLKRLAVALTMLGLLVVAAYARVVPAAPHVFVNDEVRLLGGDAYYHLRHTRFVVEHYPHLQRWDIGTHYPRGQRSRAAGLYDLAMATTAMVLGRGHPSDRLVERVVAWTPAVLGLLTFLLLFGWVRSTSGALAGLVACLSLTLYPVGFLQRTLLGFADHHAAEAVLVAWTLWGLSRALVVPERGRARGWGRAALHALPAVALQFTWAGGPLVLAILVAASFVLLLLVLIGGQPDRALGRRLLRYFAMLFVGTLGAACVWPDLVLIPRVFPATLVGLAVFAPLPLLVLALAHRLVRAGRAVWPLIVGVAAVVAVGLWLTLTLFPALGWAVGFALQAKTPLVHEHLVVSAASYWRVAGVSGLLALAAVPVWIAPAMRDARHRPAFFTAVAGTLFIVLWWLTSDYEYLAPIWIGAMTGLVVWRIADGLRGRSWLRGAVVAALAASLGIPVWVGDNDLPVVPDESTLEELVVFDEAWASAMRWLSEESIEPTLPLDTRIAAWGEDFPYPLGTYGVIAPWDFGNFVAAEGRRIPVASQGVSRRVAEWMLLDDEAEADAPWEELLEPEERLRYVVLDADALGDHFVATVSAAGQRPQDLILQRPGELPVYGPRYSNTLAARLFFGAGSEMTHYRLVYESPQRSLVYYQMWRVGPAPEDTVEVRLRSQPLDRPTVRERWQVLRENRVVRTETGFVYGARVVPSVRIFERVEGLRLRGTIQPGAMAVAVVVLRSGSDGESIRYRTSGRADPEGRFELVLPHATVEAGETDLEALGPYQIAVDSGDGPRPVARIHVSAERVRNGGTIDLGSLSDGD